MKRTLSGWSRTIVECLVAVALSLVLYALVYRVWRLDPHGPTSLVGGDTSLYMATVFKGMVDNPWYSFNRYVGAPTGLDLRDYPMPDLLFLLWVKAATWLTRNPFLIANLTLALSFPLLTLPALFALRRLGVRYSVALVASLLFAFLPYHHMRALNHVLYAVGYFSVPLATLVALDLFKGDAPRSRPSAFAMAVAVVIGLSGTVYYPFFSGFCILVAGLSGSFRRRTRVPLLRALAVLLVIGAAFAVNVAPTAIHVFEHGKVAVLDRGPQEAEIYGLKITQLLLPVEGHLFPGLDRIKEKYDRSAPLLNENASAYLGAVGCIGFLYLLGSLLVGGLRKETSPGSPEVGEEGDEALRGLRVLNLVSVLLGTIGGFGALFAYLVSPQIRGYNRLSVYIAFFSLCAVALLVERVVARSSRRVILALPALLLAVLAFGIVDQSESVAPRYEAAKREFVDDDDFIQRIEASVPRESSVFQLPYIPFPESGPVEHLPDYGAFRPYLHSKTLHWSYGSMRGRRGDGFSQDLSRRSSPEMIDALATAGFAGIHVSRDAYADHGAAIEAEIGRVLGAPTIVSPRGDAAFYPLGTRAEHLRAEMGDVTFGRKREEVTTPVFLGWLDGYYPPEGNEGSQWVWCRAHGRFVLENPSTTTRTIALEMTVRAAEGTATITIDGDLFHEVLHTDPVGLYFTKTIDVPPGEHFLSVRTDGGRLPNHARDLYFAMFDARVAQGASAASGGLLKD